MVMPKDRVRGLMERTQENLDFVQKHKTVKGPYEVTQLVNSFLGAFVHPKEAWIDRIPETPPPSDWPAIPTDAGYAAPKHCRDLVRLIRNGMAHGNFDLLPDAGDPDEIGGLRIWNNNPKTCSKTWGTELAIADVEKLLRAFIKLMIAIDDKRLSKNP